MRDGWETTNLGELLSLRSGKPSPAKKEFGAHSIYGSNGPIGRSDEANCPENSIVIGRVGANCGSVHFSSKTSWVTDNALVALANERSESYFLYYLLSSLGLNTLSQGSGQPLINQQIIKSIPVTVPSVPDQAAIGEVLRAFDDLIQTNQQLSADLDGIAAAVIEAIPTIVPLGDFARQVRVKGAQPKGSVDHFSLPAFDAGRLPESIDGKEIKSNKLMLPHPVTLVSRLNPRISRNWMVYPGNNDAVASTEFVVLEGRGCDAELVYAVTQTKMFKSGMNERASGTTGSHQRVDKDAVVEIEVPDAHALDPERREAVVESVRAASELRVENHEVTKTRDALLPLLLSGKITPNSAAKLLEGV